MRLISARIQNYRSIKDSGVFQIENLKTILVGTNEAGKTLVLQALQRLSRSDTDKFNPLRDYPRSMYDDIATQKVDLSTITVVTGYFELEKNDLKLLTEEFKDCRTFTVWRNLDNSRYCSLDSAVEKVIYKDIKDDLIGLAMFVDNCETFNSVKKTLTEYKRITKGWSDLELISGDKKSELRRWLDSIYNYVANDNVRKKLHDALYEKLSFNNRYDEILKKLDNQTPEFILFKNYYRVKASICLERLAQQVEENINDYGNFCLLKYLGFTAKELSESVKKAVTNNSDESDVIDERRFRLNSASAKLEKEISTIWSPDSRKEISKLKIRIDGQYLKVVVEDDLGVDIELDQRSEGFQWLFSFFVVFFAEAMDKHKNTILLFDEPGMSLHAVKQREFRGILSKLAEMNQLIYTTHSPFLVGSDELNSVRVVELKNRLDGTKIHTIIKSDNPISLLPLQEALGYNLSQCMFAQRKNVILEGLTDYWYISSTEQLLRKAKDNIVCLDKDISFLFANSASKIISYATILDAQKFKVAVLFDSDTEGDIVANNDGLKHILGDKKILRVHSFCTHVKKPEIEDLLRDTLTTIVSEKYKKDVTQIEGYNSTCSIVDIFKKVPNFRKKDLALSYLKWANTHSMNDLSENEIKNWTKLIIAINNALK